MAIGLQRNNPVAHTSQLLEALAYVGFVPAEVWPRDAYGIDLAPAQPPPVRPAQQQPTPTG